MSCSLKSLLLFGALCGAGVSADLRAASQPAKGYIVRRQGQAAPFVSKSVIYIEPSDFNYQGLKQQRDGGAYDNFLRSNIDNEQDKRNFNTEDGKDMLPFRSYEGGATDNSNTIKNKIPEAAPVGPVINATPDTPVLYPLRWNNPHASELEVNVWIMNVQNNNGLPVVVPIRKPTCSGEGHQDNVIQFTVPASFNSLGDRIPGFTGCKAEGQCVLQVYAHSVEPRTYSIGVPIVISGAVPPSTAASLNVEPAQKDVGLALGQLQREICLPSSDPNADIKQVVPRQARLVSDVFNHAYQNSDYSPYSGQQPEAISKNLQAASIVSMIPANRGELGKALLQKQNAKAAQFAANLRNKVKNLVQRYEGLTNKIIAKIGNSMANADTTLPQGQKTGTCFRCAEVGATTTQRLTTNTYVPSFKLETAEQVATAKAQITNQQYEGLISAGGVVQIYRAVFDDLQAEFQKAIDQYGLKYQPAALKSTVTTMADPKQFKKLNANNQRDNGVYAATQAQTKIQSSANSVSQQVSAANSVATTPLMAALSADDVDYGDIGTASTVSMVDEQGLNYDTACDDETNITNDCPEAAPMFASACDGSDGLTTSTCPTTTTTTTTTTTPTPPTKAKAGSATTTTTINTGLIVGIAAGAGVLMLLH